MDGSYPSFGGHKDDDPPAREVEKPIPELPERIIEVVPEVPFIERELSPGRR